MFLNVDQLEKQLEKKNFKRLDPWLLFKYSRHKFVKKSIDKRALHKREYDSMVNERQMQTTEEKVDTNIALDASLVDTKSNGTESVEQDTSNRSGNDAHADDTYIRPIYDEELMAENTEQCHDTRPLSAKLTDNHTTELSNQSLESENICLKRPLSRQHGQFLKVKSNEAKIKHDIDIIKIINIELEHKVAKLLKENEILKKHYKDLYDSIKVTRTKTIEQTTSLIAKNDEFKAQLQEKGFAIAALKNYWMSKKQDCTAMSSAEAEYVALSASCAQVMWMRTQLKDYGFNYNKIPLYCDSQSAIAISCNPVQHSRTKHIHTRYHFIKEQVENGIIELYFVRTEYQLADMFTKALPEDRFQYLVRRIGMRCLTPAELEVLANESA
ncbi:hypothetical protein Tco_0875307 [Tanacetum coccineum]|uniref:Retrovirus-related Pol polyprotein from transposon TNT 1-94 n=1 Tax=Tanacetum coccineum TaxID=301880 RepID=A0ABQ5BPF2_9ASTR